MMVLCILHLLLLKSFIVTSVTIDNDVLGDPVIECGDNSMTFSVKTRKLFAGRIYVRGKTAETPCIRADFTEQQTTTPAFELSFGNCGMKGQRSMFVTEVDKSYHVKCFFEETLRTITAGVDVSMISTADVTAFRTSNGACTYTIHQGTISGGTGSVGPMTSVAQVGDKIVHKWECNDAMYGILVRNCYVTDGFGTQAEVIDKRGCPVDPVLISTISYDSSLTQAFAESHVFKFADRPGVWFYCQLQMCLKMSQACDALTPPRCGMMSPSGSRLSTRSNRTSTLTPTSTPTPTPTPTKLSTTNATLPNVPINDNIPAFEFDPETASSPSSTRPSTVHLGSSTNSNRRNSRLPPAPAYFDRHRFGDRKEFLIQHENIEENRSAIPKAQTIYEEEELIYDEAGIDDENTTTVSGVITNRTESIVIGSIEKSIAYRAHRRGTTSGARVKRDEESDPRDQGHHNRDHLDHGPDQGDQLHDQGDQDDQMADQRDQGRAKRDQDSDQYDQEPYERDQSHDQLDHIPDQGYQPHDRGDHDSQLTTRKLQEITRTIRRPTWKAIEKQYRTSNDHTNRPSNNEDTFMYKDSELSNRLIIFDVDDEPPPGYMHWSKRPVLDKSNAESHEKLDHSKRTSSAETCVVSSQGLIMILSTFGIVSILFVVLFVFVCVKYRLAVAKDKHRVNIERREYDSKYSDMELSKSNGWRMKENTKHLDTFKDAQLPRLSMMVPNERRKQR